MKFFLDTANLEELRTAAAWGMADGVTTNPTLIAREGNPVEKQIAAICEIISGDVSAEVLATEYEKMVEEGRKLSGIHPNVVVKLPLTRDGIKATATLSKEKIRVNVTLCFTATQALIAAKAGAYIISPFVGRLDDLAMTGMELVEEIVTIYDNYGYDTQVLAASIRSPLHVKEAAMIGAHIATIPFKVVDSLFNHPLTDNGLARFLKDYAKAFDSDKAK
ncbi:MAG: fructose-6-phosphate aldolase [Bryobacterales bacterium]|nr:fructose-6-phosphate aldolase [Bryobacterales bacterium]